MVVGKAGTDSRIRAMTLNKPHPSTIGQPPRGQALGESVRQIIGVYFDVYNEIGYGLSESICAAAFAMVLEERGFQVRREVVLDYTFRGQCIGRYRADLVVNEAILIEVKAGELLPRGSKAQLLNYLRISGMRAGLVVFFGPIPEFKRLLL
jgi:GxxExxY protein